MNENVLKWVGAGVLGLLAVVGIVVFMQRGARLEMTGQVLKVRTAPITDTYAIAVLDFRAMDVSDVPAVVRNVTVYEEDQNGVRTAGKTISEPDAKRVFDAIPLLGPKYNKSLVYRDRIPERGSLDRMIAATFQTPAAALDQRKRFVITIEEIDGGIFEIDEKK
ncbi:MAG TPA: hypothetical protein VMU19_10245 [Bryobacteraceae bacterium]|nr:hypothetical protein [Bryobacteraceae bacterium]